MGESKLLEAIKEKETPEGFIRTTDQSVKTLDAGQKVILNRKGNELFNNGNTEGARRIFTTTGYSDGLTRVGKTYEKENKPLAALKQYVLAKNQKNAAPLYEKAAGAISEILRR